MHIVNNLREKQNQIYKPKKKESLAVISRVRNTRYMELEIHGGAMNIIKYYETP
jgi:hypothetical protein